MTTDEGFELGPTDTGLTCKAMNEDDRRGCTWSTRKVTRRRPRGSRIRPNIRADVARGRDCEFDRQRHRPL